MENTKTHFYIFRKRNGKTLTLFDVSRAEDLKYRRVQELFREYLKEYGMIYSLDFTGEEIIQLLAYQKMKCNFKLYNDNLEVMMPGETPNVLYIFKNPEGTWVSYTITKLKDERYDYLKGYFDNSMTYSDCNRALEQAIACLDNWEYGVNYRKYLGYYQKCKEELLEEYAEIIKNGSFDEKAFIETKIRKLVNEEK